MPKPDKDAETMSLNLRKFPTDLYWKCIAKAATLRMEIGEFVQYVLNTEVTENAKRKNRKRPEK